MRPVSVRVRLTLWYVGLLAVILAAFGAGVYLTQREALYHNLDESIESRANAELAGIRFDDEGPLLSNGFSSRTGDEDNFVRILDGSGPPAGPSDARVRVRRFPIFRGGETVALLEVGQSEEHVSESLSTLLVIMGVAYPVTLLVAVFGGVFLAGRALSPVDRITGMARRISVRDLGQRLNLRLPNDEIGRLARTFDSMIERLDDAFQRQRRLTADAAHELRTPLTVMKGQVEVALQRERSPTDYQDTLKTVNSEVDRLAGLVGSLLTLARADAGEIRLNVTSVDVGELVSSAVEHLRTAADQKQITMEIESSDDVKVDVDEELILQLLINLLDNAIKYTPDGGRVTVGWSVSDSGIELWVRHTGIGIPQEHLPQIMDRFYRVDDARSRADGGAGLGLAISRWIAEAHNGLLRAESTPNECSTFTVIIPIGD